MRLKNRLKALERLVNVNLLCECVPQVTVERAECDPYPAKRICPDCQRERRMLVITWVDHLAKKRGEPCKPLPEGGYLGKLHREVRSTYVPDEPKQSIWRRGKR